MEKFAFDASNGAWKYPGEKYPTWIKNYPTISKNPKVLLISNIFFSPGRIIQSETFSSSI